MKKTVRVTQKDIREGERHDEGACPIALAVKRTFPGHEVCVASASIAVFEKDSAVGFSLALPARIQRFVQRFDALGRRHVRPFRFEMEV